MTARDGEIVTFYSYKGGTGRSMLLANIAWILGSNGRRVLVLDWDLEAPGVHRYFLPFMVDKDLTASDGIIDFVIDFSVAALEPAAAASTNGEPWFAPYANVVRYASSLDWEFSNGGTIDFVGAGRQGPSYSTRVNSFDWQGFYDRYGGGALLEEMKRIVKERYDFVLVDSRTGVSDTAGICTLQLPDTLVVCFTLNNQSIEGAAAVTDSVYEQRARTQRIRILPVPMRVENSEKEKLETRKAYARRRFARFPEGASGPDLDRYWADVEMLYVPFYAYEEILATFGDRPGEQHSILAAAERLASHLTNGKVKRSARPSEGRRLEVLAAYEGMTPPPPVEAPGPSDGRVYISYRREDAAGVAGGIYDALSAHFGAGRIFTDVDAISPGRDVVEVVDDAVSSAGVVVAVIGPHWLDARDRTGRRRLDDPNDFVRRELATALSRNTRVIPVLVDGAAMPAPEDLPSDLVPLSRRNALTLTPGDWRRDVDRLSSTIEVALAADRRGATLEAPTGAESAYGDERLTSLLKADHRLRRVRWIALGLAIVVLLAVAALLAVLAWYGDDASGPGTVAPVDPIYFAAGGRIFTVGSGGQNELFSGSGGDAEPDWSPDGERMAVARAGEIVVLGPGGEQLRPLTAGALNDDGPSWSPDGTLVAFDRQQSTGSSETDVWIVGMDGAAHNLTEGRRTGASPDWSPDERRIVFQRRGAIYLMRADGTAEERIQLDVAGTALDPAWSPDGAKIAFALSGDSGWNIYAYALDSRTLQNLTAGRVSGARSPAWSSDGDRIAFAADDGIWTVAADGTSLSKVVTGQGLEAPTWRPGTE